MVLALRLLAGLLVPAGKAAGTKLDTRSVKEKF